MRFGARNGAYRRGCRRHSIDNPSVETVVWTCHSLPSFVKITSIPREAINPTLEHEGRTRLGVETKSSAVQVAVYCFVGDAIDSNNFCLTVWSDGDALIEKRACLIRAIARKRQ